MAFSLVNDCKNIVQITKEIVNWQKECLRMSERLYRCCNFLYFQLKRLCWTQVCDFIVWTRVCLPVEDSAAAEGSAGPLKQKCGKQWNKIWNEQELTRWTSSDSSKVWEWTPPYLYQLERNCVEPFWTGLCTTKLHWAEKSWLMYQDALALSWQCTFGFLEYVMHFTLIWSW